VLVLPLLPTQRAPCPKPAVAVAPREPYVTRGPTEIVVGLYFQGGALIPGCRPQPRGPYAGTVSVSAHGRVVARETLQIAGRLFVLRVMPGTYVIDARDNAPLRPVAVTVHRDQTVRQDLFTDAP
jgi:hypothetical protein